MWDDETIAESAGAADSRDAPMVLVERYHLQRVLGSGGFGRVWLARDRLTDEDVAVKITPALSPTELEQARQEVTALRWARLPGVVRLRDDGYVGADYFIVMDRVAGEPFPGRSGTRWAALGGIARRLLESLARVHLAGLVHRDLKPANVLVDADGHPTLIDFGIARAAASDPEQRFTGTVRYAAPEQLRGQRAEARSDLYSVGVMLYEALTGAVPHAGETPAQLVRRRLTEPAPPIAPRVDLPPTIAQLIDRLLAREPAHRPESALEALEALGAVGPPIAGWATESLTGRVDQAELATLFHGPDAFFHLREDAARVLWDRSGGDRRAAFEELGAWLRAGIAHWVDGAVRIERPAIDRLEGGLRLSVTRDPSPASDLLTWIRLAWPTTDEMALRSVVPLARSVFDAELEALIDARRVWRLSDGRLGTRVHAGPASGWSDARRKAALQVIAETLDATSPSVLNHLIAMDPAAATLPSRIAEVARMHAESGRFAAVRPAVELGLALARRRGDARTEEALLRLVTLAALGEEAPIALDEARFELGRGPSTPNIERLEALLSAARCALDGEAERALALLDMSGPFTDEGLEIWRMVTRVAATRHRGPEVEAAFLDGLASWAEGSERRHAWRLGWLANLDYRQGRYLDAARRRAESARLKRSAAARVGSLYNCAAALVEAEDFEAAARIAEQAATEAAALRHAKFEALSVWTLRVLAYRRGATQASKPELVTAAARLGPAVEGLFALNEATIAWRAGEAEAKALATIGERRLRSARAEVPRLLARGLLVLMGEVTGAAALDALAQDAMRCPVAEIGVQVLGMALRVHEEPRWRTAALDLAQARAKSTWGRRLDVLSFEEALGPAGTSARLPLGASR